MIKIYFGLFETLGDIIVSTSLIRTIKEKYPDSHITYCVGRDYIDVLANNPDISEVIGAQHQHEIVIRSTLQKYDKIFLPLMLTNFDTIWHQLSPWCIDNGDRHNLVDFYAKRCQDDLEITNRRTYIYPQDKHWEEIISNVPETSRQKFVDTPFITVHTTSRNQSKDWKYSSFADLTRKIKDKYGDAFNIYQIGGKGDKELPSPVHALMGMPVLNTAALMKKSMLHIDIDSGPSFIADSLDIPTVCLMGATWAQTSGPIGPNVTFIEPPRECIGTATHTPCHSNCIIKKNCIDKIEVDEVYSLVEQKLDEILAGRKKDA